MTDNNKPIVGVVMGSDSDWPIMKLATEVLDKFNVIYEAKVVSAHRTPDTMYEYAATANKQRHKMYYCWRWWRSSSPWNVGIKNGNTCL